MKKVIFILLSLQSLINYSFEQTLDGYKFVIVGTLIYQNGEKDVFGISSTIKTNFEKEGLQIISEDNANWPLEARQNPCLILFCVPFTEGNSTVGYTIKNCKNEMLFDQKSTSANWTNNIQDNYNRALKKSWNQIDKLSYSFNKSLTPELQFPEVEKLMKRKNP